MNEESGKDKDEYAPQSVIPELPHQYGRGPVAKGVTAASMAFLAAGAGPFAPAVSGLAAAIEGFGDRINQRAAERDRMLISSTASQANLSLVMALAELGQKDEYLMLTAEAVDAARRTRNESKVKALGQSLGAILQDEASIDEEAVWIRILSRIEPPHLRVLHSFVEPTGTMGNGRQMYGARDPRSVEEVGRETGLGALVLALCQEMVQLGLLMEPAVNGLVSGSPDAYGQRLKAGPLAMELLVRLWEAAQATEL